MTDYVSAVTRQNINALRSMNDDLSRSSRRMASGQRYAGLVENASAVMTARNMRARSDHLDTVIQGYADARGAIRGASAGLSSITKLVDKLRVIGRQIAEAEPATIGTPAIPGTPATPPSGPQTLTVFSRQIATNVDGNAIAGDAKTIAENAILGPWNRNEFTRYGASPNTVENEIFVAKNRAYIPHVTEPPSRYSSIAQKNNKVDRLRITATDGTTTKTEEWYFGHAGSAAQAVVDSNLVAGSDDIFTVKHLVQAINRDLGDYIQAEVTSNGRMKFEVAGDIRIELVERSPGPSSPTKPWDSLTNLFGVIEAGADGDMTTDLNRFEFSTGTGGTANIGAGNDAGNYAITYTPGTRPTGGFTATIPVTPGTPGTDATGLLKQWDDVAGQIEAIVRDSGFNGLNLLHGTGGEISLSERSEAPRLRIPGAELTLERLGISRSNGDFSTPAEVEARLAELDAAALKLERLSVQISVAQGIVGARETFTSRMMSELDNGADALTLIDPSEEAASLLATRTRIELASTALSLGVGSERSVVDMLTEGTSRIRDQRERAQARAETDRPSSRGSDGPSFDRAPRSSLPAGYSSAPAQAGSRGLLL